MQDIQEMLHTSAQRVFAAHTSAGTPAPGMEQRLWRDLAEIGLPNAMAAEAAGGASLTPQDALPLLRTAGAHAVSVPLADTMVAHWIASKAGLALPEGPVALGPTRPDELDTLTIPAGDSGLHGELSRIGWARTAASLMLICGPAHAPCLLLIEAPGTSAGISVAEGSNLAGEPRDTLSFKDAKVSATMPSPWDAATLLAAGAVARSLLIAGACAQVLKLCVEYANLREQFGRPIGKFQAIQQNLANLAAQAAAAQAASDIGLASIGDTIDVRGAAIAKLRTAQAASTVAAIAHQAFGAIGFTEEHSLHRYTRRLWSWSDEWGPQRYWARTLGQRLAASPLGLWPALTECPLTSPREA